MVFTSAVFLLFLLLVVSIHYLLPLRFRGTFLLLASFVFIGSYNTESLITVIISSAFNFYIALKVRGNRLLYIAGIAINAYAIVMFNYFHATQQGLDFSYTLISFNMQRLIIALGLSFYSLQHIAYLSGIYSGGLQPETNFIRYALYTSFFPKVISGPVMLPAEFLPQPGMNTVTKEKLAAGFNRFLFGLFKKMVIADRLSPAVHSVFDFNDHYSGLTTLLGAYLFTIQLYFDFSGYTDMALGIAKMLGYDLKENFNLPLRSASVAEFWRRWHISLISWFTAYIYYPVVYRLRRYKKAAALAGIFLTFFISGIWHGIGFTFLAWALCHSIYLAAELLTKRWRVSLAERWSGRLYRAFCVFGVFNLVCFSNIFFRASSFAKALQLTGDLFSGFWPGNLLHDLVAPLAVGGHQADEFNFYSSLLLTATFLAAERRLNKAATGEKISIVFVTVLILLIFVFGIFSSGERFIYMQF